MRSAHLIPGAEPFFYPGSEIGCLVLHGFTSSPQEVRWLGQHLNRQGYTVYGPRLAGHGTAPSDMRGVTWREWVFDALAGYQLLRDRCRKVAVVGLSMGAALSLILAANEDVAAVAALATPYEIGRRWRRPLLRLAVLAGWSFNKTAPPEGDHLDEIVRAEQAARGEVLTGRISYPRYPAWGVAQLWALLDAMRAELPRVTAPALLIQSTEDDVVPTEHVERIYAALGSVDKRKLILTAGHHVITEDVMREEAFKAVGEFFAGLL